MNERITPLPRFDMIEGEGCTVSCAADMKIRSDGTYVLHSAYAKLEALNMELVEACEVHLKWIDKANSGSLDEYRGKLESLISKAKGGV